MINLTLPIPPSANAMYRHSRRGVSVAPAVKNFRQRVLWEVEATQPGLEPLTGPFKVEVQLAFQDRRKHDIDNPIKVLFDALTLAGVWVDDCHVDELHVIRLPMVGGGRCTVQISKL